MPKKAIEFSNNINIRISDEQKDQWNKYLKNNKEFSSISHFFRWCVDQIVEGTYLPLQGQNNNNSLRKAVQENERKIKLILERLDNFNL